MAGVASSKAVRGAGGAGSEVVAGVVAAAATGVAGVWTGGAARTGRDRGAGCGERGLGYRVRGLGCGDWGTGSRMRRFRVRGLGYRGACCEPGGRDGCVVAGFQVEGPLSLDTAAVRGYIRI